MIHPNSTASLDEQKATGHTTTFRRAVYETLARTVVATDRQIATLIDEPDLNNIRPEITRLKKDGLVQESGKVKCFTTGRLVRQCCITGKPYFDR